MKQYLFITCLLFLGIITQAQNPASATYLEDQLKQVTPNQPNIEFIQLAKTAAQGMSAACCFYDECTCTDLKDPWEEDEPTTEPSDEPEEENQEDQEPPEPKDTEKDKKEFAAFEQAAAQGIGGKLLPVSTVKAIRSKYKGNSFTARYNRMALYIYTMQKHSKK